MTRVKHWTPWHMLYGPAKVLDGLFMSVTLGMVIVDKNLAFRIARRIALYMRARGIPV